MADKRGEPERCEDGRYVLVKAPSKSGRLECPAGLSPFFHVRPRHMLIVRRSSRVLDRLWSPPFSAG